MAIGPVQLLVLRFDRADFRGDVVAELGRLDANEAVRVIDALGVYKDADGGVRVEHLGGPGDPARLAASGVSVLSDADAWGVVGDIPADSAAAVILLEHHWAVPLRDAILRSGGTRITDDFIGPLDLVAIGLATVEEAKALEDAILASPPPP